MTEFKIKGILYSRKNEAREISTEVLIERLKRDCYGFNTAKDLRDEAFFDNFYYHFCFDTKETTVEDIQKNIENGFVYFPFASSVDMRTILLYLENGFEARFMTLKDFREVKKAMLKD